MFVQLNPDATSYSETLSTLKFAERVSGVELGAAKSNKDSKEVRELMDQVMNVFAFIHIQLLSIARNISYQPLLKYTVRLFLSGPVYIRI